MKSPKDQYTVLTGGAGFIGSGVLRTLNDLGHPNIIVVDNLGTGDKWKNLVGKQVSDVLHKDHLFSWLEGKAPQIQAFIHLGACSSTVETDANYLLENNYRYSRRLAEYAIKHGIRFIYASSAATYGDGTKGFKDDHSQLESLEPLNMYGHSKHLFDLWLKQEGHLDKVAGLKFFNVYGPNEYHKGRMASQIIRMVPQVKNDGVIKLFKSYDKRFPDGGQMRDFIYIKDVASMIASFLKNNATGIYNLGTGTPNTWNQLATAVFNAMGKPVKIEYIAMPDDLQGKYQYYTEADTKKAEKTLGKDFKVTPLAKGVEDYVQNYLLTGKIW